MRLVPIHRARIVSISLLVLIVLTPTLLFAHRSDCHRWHSCPSDSGSYVCGDLERCEQCPDNQYCQNRTPRVIMPHASGATSSEILRLNHEGFTVLLDCARRGVVKFRYNTQRDQGNLKRHHKFYLDPGVPKRCQQMSAASYKHPTHKYDRGHLVPANHLDFSANAIKLSNYVPNNLLQAANMNRGAWLLTEEIVECYRDIDGLLVLGGVIWGNHPRDDYFVKSHGVRWFGGGRPYLIWGRASCSSWACVVASHPRTPRH